MIINLIGHIASGKTTFARWFLEKCPSWKHLDIAQIRRTIRTRYPNEKLQRIEELAWLKLDSSINLGENFLIESTGVLHQLKDIWTSERANQGIYTVKFMAPLKVCQKRAQARVVLDKLDGYDLDEDYAIWLEDEYQQTIPANLSIETTSLLEIERQFEEAYAYIQKAQECFRIYEHACILGYNTHKE